MATRREPEPGPDTSASTSEPDGLAEIRAEQTRQAGVLEGIQQTLAKLGGAEKGAQQTAQTGRAAELEAPTNVAEELRRQLDERDAKRAAADAGKAQSDKIAELEKTVARLTETPPDTPVRRVEKVMGWRG